MSVIIGALAALASIAVSIGATHVTEAINRYNAEKQRLTPTEVSNIVDQIVKTAKTKGNQVYQKVLSQLENTQLPPVASDKVTRLVMANRKKLVGLKDEALNLLNKAEVSENRAQNIASGYSYLSQYEKNRINKPGSTANTLKNQAENAAQEAKKTYSQIGDIERKI